MNRLLPRLLLASLLGMASPAFADIDAIDIGLEDLLKVRILSMPKFAENPDQIPSVVSILTAEDIRLFGWRTLADALRTLQGFNITDDHTYSYAGVRGISPPGDYRPRLQILIDGVSVNESIYGSAPTDSTFPLDLALIERIEVVRGPSAAVYGGDAMFGVINIVTRSGQSLNGGETSLSLGSGSDRRLRASLGGEINGTDLLFSVTGFDSNGRSLQLNDLNSAGESQRISGVGSENGGQLFFRARGDDWRFTLIHSERDRIVTNGSYGTIANDRTHVELDRYSLADLSKDWQVNAKTVLQQRLYVGKYAYDGEFPYDYSPDDPHLMNVDVSRNTWWGIENRLVSNAMQGQRWTFGLEYKANTQLSQDNFDRGYGCFDTGSSSPCLQDRRQTKQFTLFTQDEIQIGSASTLTLGLRHDRLGDLGNFTSPRLGFVHDAGRPGIFKLLYGTAFRTPTPYEQAYLTPTFSYGNPNIGPEKMKSLELAWEKKLTTLSRLTAAVYTMKIENLVTPDAAGIVMNGSAVNANGLELEYEQQWRNGSRLRTGYSTQYASSGETGKLDNSPRHMLKFNLAVPTGLAGLMAGLEGQWIGQRLAASGQQKVDAYTLANLNFSYAPNGQAWDASFAIHNLFDHHYNDPVAVDNDLPVSRWYLPQLGRSLRLQMTYRF